MSLNVKDFFVRDGSLADDHVLIKEVLKSEQDKPVHIGGGIYMSYSVESMVKRLTNAGSSYDVTASAKLTFGDYEYTISPKMHTFVASDMGINLYRYPFTLSSMIVEKAFGSKASLEAIVKATKSLKPLFYVASRAVEKILEERHYDEHLTYGDNFFLLSYILATLAKVGHSKTLQDREMAGKIFKLLQDNAVVAVKRYNQQLSRYERHEIFTEENDFTFMMTEENHVVAISKATGIAEPPSSKAIARFRLSQALQK